MQEDIILTTAVTVMKKKYTDQEEALIKQITSPKAKIEVLVPEDMSAEAFDVAISAVSKVLVRATMQKEAMFPILGRLLYVAEKNPELWNKKHEKFKEFRLSLADRFGLSRSTSYDALEYARRWYGVLPPGDFTSVGRVKTMMISKYIGKGDEDKATARKLFEFSKDHTAEELDAKLDELLHTGKGASAGAFLKIPCNKKQLKAFLAFFGDPRIHAVCESGKSSDILEHMIEECSGEWFAQGEQLVEAAQEAAQQAEKDGVPAEGAA